MAVTHATVPHKYKSADKEKAATLAASLFLLFDGLGTRDREFGLINPR
jgi:hypothetical protein